LLPFYGFLCPAEGYRGPQCQPCRACANLCAMSTDFRPAAAPASTARAQASPMPLKPSLEGIEDKWSRQWEEAGVVQV
jgi:hypothetical protein